MPDYVPAASDYEEDDDLSEEKTQLLSIEEMESQLGLNDNQSDFDSVQDAAKTIPLDSSQVEAFMNQQGGMQQPGMQAGMQPGMQAGMQQPGMQAGMQPGMHPGMQPGMHPGMQAGMQPGGMQAGMQQPGYNPYMPHGTMAAMMPYGPPEKSNAKLIIILVILALLIVGGGIGAYLFMTKSAATETANEETETKVETPPPAMVSVVTIKSSPAGANVTINGIRQPRTTPIFGYQANVGDALQLRFELKGYETLQVKRDLIQQSQTIEVSLKPLPTTPTDPLVDGGDPINGGDPLVDGGDPLVDGGDPLVDGGDPPVDGGDPLVDGGDPLVDGGDPPVDGGDPLVDGGGPGADPAVLASIEITSKPDNSEVYINGESKGAHAAHDLRSGLVETR